MNHASTGTLSASVNTKDKKSAAEAVGTKCLRFSENKLRLRRVSQDATSGDKLASVVETQLPD